MKRNLTLEFILKKKKKKIDEARKYFLEEIKHNELISKKHKMACKTLNHVEHLLILTSTFTAVGSPLGILQFCSWIKNLCNKSQN